MAGGSDYYPLRMNQQQAKRLADAVKWTEQQPRQTPGSAAGANNAGARLVLALVSSATGNAGIYNGKTCGNAPDSHGRSGNLTATDLGTLASTEDCQIWHLAEMGGITQPLAIGATVMGWLFQRSNASGDKPVLVVQSLQAPSQLITITGYSGAGPTSWGPYQTVLQDGTTAGPDCWNGAEDCSGAPGKLGVNISAADGTVNGTACVVQPIGNITIVITWDSVNSKWWFTFGNSAQVP